MFVTFRKENLVVTGDREQKGSLSTKRSQCIGDTKTLRGRTRLVLSPFVRKSSIPSLPTLLHPNVVSVPVETSNPPATLPIRGQVYVEGTCLLDVDDDHEYPIVRELRMSTTKITLCIPH